MTTKRITLAHGNGGRHMRELIETVFAANLGSDALDVTVDASPVAIGPGTPFVTTDAFTVKPLAFPGGDIGSLAVNGTVNDLAVAGARPLYMTLSAIIEEGLEITSLERFAASAGAAARAAGVRIVAGDTKVVPRGEGGGLYLVTTGIGLSVRRRPLGLDRIRPGDVLIASGPLGDHGTAVMLARGEFDLATDILSDCAPVTALAECLGRFAGLRFMRDPTRGGLATAAHEIAVATGLGLRLREADVPFRDEVRSVCAILGFDPYYLASEGRIVAVVAPEDAPAALTALKAQDGGRHAAIIGEMLADTSRVVLETEAGGERILEELEDDPLPRIC